MSTAAVIDHIVWDWNGTIFGDARALINATIDAFAACGMPLVTRADYQRHHTQPITRSYERQPTGHRQSLLSMYPHDRLVPLVTAAAIVFSRVDGMTHSGPDRKAPHLRRHLRRQHAVPERTVLIGDSVDDVLAAQECGTRYLIYHSGDDALHARDHFVELGVPVVASLRAAVEQVIGGAVEGQKRVESVVAAFRAQQGAERTLAGSEAQA
ncbi:MAG TPA: HAD-IA family hydrolase [Jiangellales bacterium]|nr:HAD-IA family hydrolase [Jiangellales bacterium]